ncbi:MAG: adenylate/guanylate cyclase domain-containing protein [Spirochaetaceae bacterium]|nr:adenylate/guanylate cyclase domain-containing protein [Spirochaetaceae bacterium]MBQ8352958.1 adenylate/guanylate cyclase domain-containing protein [Spirochaetaceae bacterium]
MKRNRFFQYVGDTPIIPISSKILLVFIVLLLLSNFFTNFVNLQLNQRQIINLTNQNLVNQLKEIYTTATNQYEIYKYSQDKDESINSIIDTAKKGFSQNNSMVMGVEVGGRLLLSASASENEEFFWDSDALYEMNEKRLDGITEGSIYFNTQRGEFLGVYKYHEDWRCYFLRAELVSDMNSSTVKIFALISGIICIITVIFLWIGLVLFNKILSNIKRITEGLYRMQASQSMELIDLSGASNDDITYLGASFNSLSATINNLLGIFQKFVSKDVVNKAYSDHIIRLEGTQRELTMLFSDIKGFTYMTETLGNDIINLLNIHYDKVIHNIHQDDGVIGSIIGDAVLAMYGTFNFQDNKSVQAVRSAWSITRVTAELREKLIFRRKEIEETRPLTESEEKVFKAVLLDVGVGIDGGTVFYGNIGSSEHMTNTVIGDNVNSASRLEGLTRVYKIPVIVSEYVKNEVETATSAYKFIEIDTVQVKGKTEGKKIFFPIDVSSADEEIIRKYEIFQLGLQAYYDGDWKQARALFKTCELDVGKVFLERISIKQAPADWSGIWTMTTK